MEDLPLGRIAALVPEFVVKDLLLGSTHDDDDDVSEISKCRVYFVFYYSLNTVDIGTISFVI